MPTLDVPRGEWPQFLESYSGQHRAWLATVERQGEPGMRRGDEPRPLSAVTPRRDGARVSAIEIVFAGDSTGDVVRIDNPAAVRVRTTDEGADRGLDILDQDGACTRIAFRAAAIPEMLDGLAPGEL
jgi:hypothetical protein